MVKTGFYVDMDDLREIEAALGMTKDKSKMVLRAAINSVAKQTEKRMVDETKRTYKYKRGASDGFANTVEDLRKSNKVERAKTGNMVAAVVVKGAVNELLGFEVSPMLYVPGGGYPEWYKARTRRDGRMQKIALRPGASGDQYKGFIIRYTNHSRNGETSQHYALAQRVPGKKMKANPHKEAVKSLLSISAPKAEEIVYREEIEDDMYEILERSIEEQIHRFVK